MATMSSLAGSWDKPHPLRLEREALELLCELLQVLSSKC